MPGRFLTPYEVWLAMVAVCTVSYVSYLLQRYVIPSGAGLLTAVLGGFYSATVTTVVLARRARTEPATSATGADGDHSRRVRDVSAAIDRYLLLQSIAGVCPAPELLGLLVLGLVLAAALYWLTRSVRGDHTSPDPPPNPLELGTTVIFAVLFVVVSIVSSWAARQFGTAGVYALATIVGMTDINPFVLSLAQNGAGEVPLIAAAAAVLI
jgi:uncharacterized membrane protein (DUF4010 family)